MSKESSADSKSTEGNTVNRKRKEHIGAIVSLGPKLDRSRWYVSAKERLGDITWKIAGLIDPKERIQMIMDLLAGDKSRHIRQSQVFNFTVS